MASHSDEDGLDIVLFSSADVDDPAFDQQSASEWLLEVARQHDQSIDSLSYIFCSDDFLHEMNLRYLEHDTLTDILTFDLGYEDGPIAGECYLSIDRIRDNAAQFKVSFLQELHRVMVHGLLHLCGFSDASDDEVQAMRAAEDSALAALDLTS